MLATEVVGLNPWLALVCVLVVAAGSALQAAIGIGMGLVAAPVLGLVDPDFVPAAIVVAVIPLGFGMAVRERRHIDPTGLGWAIAGRFPGAVLGSWLVTAAGHRAVAVVIAVSVLAAVIASITRIQFRATRRNLLLAGTASGFSATAAGIGGPPMAITYQHADPATMRATIAAFFTLGGVISLAGLAAAGVLGTRELQLGLLLVPGALAGLWSAGFTVARLPAPALRATALAACAVSALVLLAEAIA